MTLTTATAGMLTGPVSDRLVVRPLDALSVVFDRQSGMTHILASPMPEILALMTDWSGTVSALTQRLADAFDIARDEAPLAEQLAARLGELTALGLVEVR
ncbi:MAG: hypothetical protein RLZZ58_1175 [Pseudomonadota bacterium]